MIELAGVLLDAKRVEVVMPAGANFAGDWTKILMRSGEWLNLNISYDRAKVALERATR